MEQFPDVLNLIFYKSDLFQVVVNENNPFTFSNTSDSNVKTRVVSIDLSNPCTGQKASVQNTSKPIVVEMDGKYILQIWEHFITECRHYFPNGRNVCSSHYQIHFCICRKKFVKR